MNFAAKKSNNFILNNSNCKKSVPPLAAQYTLDYKLPKA